MHKQRCNIFRKYPERRQPNRSIFKRLVTNLKENGAFERPVLHRKKNYDPEQVMTALLAVAEDDTVGLRAIEKEHSIPKSVSQRIVHREEYRPYKFRICRSLLPGDYERRMTFCEWFTRQCDENHNFPYNVPWTDESNFSNNGIFNRKNCYYSSTQNENRVHTSRYQHRFGFNVWCGILGTRIIGPIIYEGTLNSERYEEILRNDIENLLDDLPLAVNNNMWFQQDGAPLHNSRNNMEYLRDSFQNNLIATRGPINWRPRSPDLTPMDFFLGIT